MLMPRILLDSSPASVMLLSRERRPQLFDAALHSRDARRLQRLVRPAGWFVRETRRWSDHRSLEYTEPIIAPFTPHGASTRRVPASLRRRPRRVSMPSTRPK